MKDEPQKLKVLYVGPVETRSYNGERIEQVMVTPNLLRSFEGQPVERKVNGTGTNVRRKVKQVIGTMARPRVAGHYIVVDVEQVNAGAP